MRNLKRALSLTLASVMLLGMMVVGSSAAAGYDDVSETDNVEAIEVLQAIEVMVGDERGFGPERPVNRAEMAVVMGKLLSLDYNYYSTSCPFNDVYDWAQGWVGACAANGIVSGRGEGVYDPGSTVTAVEAASMLMRALGYFKYQNDYADGFEVSTVRQGTIIGIFDGVGSSATEPMTRNQVAQMVLNALRSAVVEPDGRTVNLTTPDGTVLTGKVNYVSVTSAKPFAHAISWTQATSVGSQNDGWIVELGERLYDGKLQLTEDTDVFGRPSRKWEYDGKGIGVYAKKELLDKEYVGDVTGKDLYDLLGSATLKDYDVYCYIDGVYTKATGAKAALDSVGSAWFDAADMNKNNKAKVGGTGTGVKTEVYVDHDKDEVYVAVINTYLAIANKDYDAKKEEVDITAYAIKKDTANLNGEYVKVAKNGEETEVLKLAIEDFPAVENVKKDDALLIQVADGEVQNFKAAEVLSAVTVSAFSYKSSVTVDGTKYDYTTTAGYKFDDNINKDYTKIDATNLKDRTYNVYLDAYGNLIGIKEVDPPKNYVFITGIDLNGSNRANQVADAAAIFIDGTMDSIKVNLTKSTLGYDKNDGPSNSVLNTWCTYTKNGDVYTIKEVNDVGVTEIGTAGQYPALVPSKTNGTLAQFNQQSTGTSDMTIDGKNYRMYGGGAKGTDYYNVYGDVDSVYITAKLGELLKGSGADTDYNNYGIIKGVVSVSTGIESTNLTAWSNGKAQSQADADDSKVNGHPGAYPKTSSGIYGLYNDKGLIIAAVVVGEDAGTAKDLVYVHSSGLEEEIDNGGNSKAAGDGLWTWTRKVIRNGEEVLLTEVGDYYNGDHSLAKMEQYRWYQVRTNADGNVIEAKEASILNTQTGSRYVTDLKLINDKVEESGVNTVLYLTAGGPWKVVDGKDVYDNTTGYTGKMEVKGDRTLAITDAEGSGIWFKDDVNVVLQYYNRNKQEKDVFTGEGVSALKEMVDIVNSELGNRGANSYYISALIENGRATTIVVYDSYNNYKRPGSEDKITGNITLADASKGMMVSANSNGTLGTAEVLGSGKTTVEIKFKAPEWAEGVNTASGDVSFKATMKVNGKAWNDKTVNSITPTDGVWTSDLSTDFDLKTYVQNGVIDPNEDTITVEISNVVWKYAKVEYKYAGGEAIAADNIKKADGTTAETKMAVADTGAAFGFKFVKAADQIVSADAAYSINGAKVATGDSTKLSDKLTGTNGSDAVNFTKIYATGGQKVVITISGVTTTSTTGNLTVAAHSSLTGDNAIEFAVMDAVPTATTIPADSEWANGLTKVAASSYILVRAKTEGVNLTNITEVFDSDFTDVTSAVSVQTGLAASKGVVYFTMPTKSVTVKTIAQDKVTVLHALVSTGAVNLQLDKAKTLSTDKDRLEYVKEYLNAKTSYNASVKYSDLEKTTATDLVIDGVEIAANKVHVGHDLVWAKVNGKDIVSNNSSDVNTDDFLSLAGVTITGAGAGIFVYKEEGATKSAVVSTDSTTAVADGAIIDTNGTAGYWKWTGTGVTGTDTASNSINVSTNVPTKTLVIADADQKTVSDGKLVKLAAALKIKVTFAADGTVGGKNLQATIGASGATAGGGHSTTADVPGYETTKTFVGATGFELSFTLGTFTGPVTAITLVLSDKA